jgi:hypothetical protein
MGEIEIISQRKGWEREWGLLNGRVGETLLIQFWTFFCFLWMSVNRCFSLLFSKLFLLQKHFYVCSTFWKTCRKNLVLDVCFSFETKLQKIYDQKKICLIIFPNEALPRGYFSSIFFPQRLWKFPHSLFFPPLSYRFIE